MKLRKALAFAICAALAISAFALGGCSSSNSSNSQSSSSSDTLSGKYEAVINVEGYDPIHVELDADAAPVTVSNFVKLCDEGYYDGLTFYRVVDGFCLQGGTKGNTASGNDSSLDPIVGEFSGNGVDNPLAEDFGYGTIAMARTSMPNSATSTFFITLGDSQSVKASLNGQYAAFGQVDADDMVTVDQIAADCEGYVDDIAMGTISDVTKQPVIKSIQIIR